MQALKALVLIMHSATSSKVTINFELPADNVKEFTLFIYY